jgi:hypothetical protein
MPQKVFSYWASNTIKKVYSMAKSLNYFADARQGLATADNMRFLRLWYETDQNRIGFNFNNREEANESKKKWFPYNKGGEYRKWYGNNEYVINWEHDGSEIRVLKDENGKIKSRPQNLQFMFRECITWSKIAQYKFAVRYQPKGYLFDVSGCSIFSRADINKKLLALLNTKVIKRLIDGVSPTVNYEVGTIEGLPIYNLEKFDGKYVAECIEISKISWDSQETSWEFIEHPLLKYSGNEIKIEEAFNKWSNSTDQQFNNLKQNEEELNRIFIKIYGLQDELTPEVEDKDITINKADRERDIKSFISYAVGCIFGRYSLDVEGLIYAGGNFSDKFRLEHGMWEINTTEVWKASSIGITKDNVIPIADGGYFEDGIVERFVEFIKVSFGEGSLEKNLDYIAETLGKKNAEISRQVIRRYFLKDFYSDHVKTYKKRPIYWLFDSGKQNGFKALIYMHRYDPYTVARVRTDYLHKLQKQYEAEINHLDVLINSNISDREKVVARKRKEVILKQIQECRSYDQAIAHVANQKIEIDLDDGVVVNYAKFQGVEIPQGEGKKPLKADLLAKI